MVDCFLKLTLDKKFGKITQEKKITQKPNKSVKKLAYNALGSFEKY